MLRCTHIFLNAPIFYLGDTLVSLGIVKGRVLMSDGAGFES